MKRYKTGIVGCGQISHQYLENLVRRFSHCIEVVALSDLIGEAARSRAQEFGIARTCSTEVLLSDPEIDIIVTLTMPAAHFDVNSRALISGKHVYGEKPFTLSLKDAEALLSTAGEKGLRIGGAPDTFLGAGLQTCRKVIDEGWIGVPVHANAFLAMGFSVPRYYEAFAGPAFDMGPYYLTALVSLLGPIQRVAGVARVPFPQKQISDPRAADYGESFSVTKPGHVTGTLQFESGACASLTMVSEIFGYFPRLEVFGSEGVLTCNDPNGFGGPIYLQTRGGERKEIPLPFGFTEGHRGLGVADMAYAIENERPHRASGALCYHVLEAIHALHESGESGRFVEMNSRVERPAPLRPGLSINPLEL